MPGDDHFWANGVIVPRVIPYVGNFFSGFNHRYIGAFSLSPGQDPTQLTTPGAEDTENPVLSPNNTKIAYVWTTSGPSSRIYVMDTDGANPVIVYDQADPGDVGSVECVVWATNSASLIFTSSWGVPDSASIYTCPATASATITTLYTDPSNRAIGNVAYNSDGSKIAFTVLLSSTSYGIWTADADGTNASQIGTGPTQFSQIFFETAPFVWFNNSSRLMWNDGTLAAPVWKAMDDDGTNVVTVVSLAYVAGPPMRQSIDPTDDHIFYTNSTATEIRQAQLDGSGNSLFLTPSATVTGPMFVFHDQRLYWETGNDIWSCLLDATDERNEASGTTDNLGLMG